MLLAGLLALAVVAVGWRVLAACRPTPIGVRDARTNRLSVHGDTLPAEALPDEQRAPPSGVETPAAAPQANEAPAPNAPASNPGLRLPVEPRVLGAMEVVREAVDGDTIVLGGGNHVRLIGVNCPEHDEPFFREATDLTARMVVGHRVALEFDAERNDTYGRVLAYVYCEGVFLNAELLRQGYATFYDWPPNDRYRDGLLDCQRQARAAGLGIWNLPAPRPEPFYVAIDGFHRFHRPDCPSIQDDPPEHRRVFATRDEAFDAGLSPHSGCRP